MMTMDSDMGAQIPVVGRGVITVVDRVQPALCGAVGAG
jgi:hypothetical protein